jgi:hypothetical protein
MCMWLDLSQLADPLSPRGHRRWRRWRRFPTLLCGLPWSSQRDGGPHGGGDGTGAGVPGPQRGHLRARRGAVAHRRCGCSCMRCLGDGSAHNRVFPLECYLTTVNKRQGIGFKIFFCGVDKRLLKQAALAIGGGVSTAVTYLLSMDEPDLMRVCVDGIRDHDALRYITLLATTMPSHPYGLRSRLPRGPPAPVRSTHHIDMPSRSCPETGCMKKRGRDLFIQARRRWMQPNVRCYSTPSKGCSRRARSRVAWAMWWKHCLIFQSFD